MGARCDLCPLGKTAIPVAPQPARKGPRLPIATPVAAPRAGWLGEVARRPQLVLVGEGPGATEEKVGAPFVGASGKLLDQLLQREARVSRETCHVTNAALCRGETDEQNERAAVCCAPRLLTEISGLPKEVPIAVMGASAVLSILGLKGIRIVRGFVWRGPNIPSKDLEGARKKVLKLETANKARPNAELKVATLEGRAKLENRVILPTLHPAYVLRSETEHPIIRLDFRRIGRATREELPPLDKLADAGKFKILEPRPSQLKKLWRLGSVVSLDVETTETGHPLTAALLCVGVGDESKSAKPVYVIWPWHPRAAPILQKFLRSRREVVGHNMISFDRVVLERHGVT